MDCRKSETFRLQAAKNEAYSDIFSVEKTLCIPFPHSGADSDSLPLLCLGQSQRNHLLLETQKILMLPHYLSI
ncbi:hypothetical protein BACCAP_01868 [Pseudoflavonifractor capillosus ATCC 29799]|uniref:Uncharacterized protein n=1 Tax=Pseudoflavonifractor capillosus ATCC 29799 TaxID=411467 RepID=A6NUI6_9FIRM|nr:hypothetical protein BACCAP_01868 [Pseudoflavonifractor capillosus ATCC 29799]